MSDQIYRVYVERKKGFDLQAKGVLNDLKNYLGITSLKTLRILNRYDILGIDEGTAERALKEVFCEPQTDDLYLEDFPMSSFEKSFGIEYLPGQYDQRADSTQQCLQLINPLLKPKVKTAVIYVVNNDILPSELEKITSYLVNPVDSRLANLGKPDKFDEQIQHDINIEYLHGFSNFSRLQMEELYNKLSLAMSFEDFLFCQEYFQKEKRDPSMTEIKVIDTYWSDHCRHTTFNTIIEKIDWDDRTPGYIKKAYEQYLKIREEVYKDSEKPITLMDLATVFPKKMRKDGKINDLEVSEEINACSVEVDVSCKNGTEKYLLMFKNETHNHPTEIEPFGGAATCLGGAIRDPLSGRAYVYQAMRVTGAADPRTPVEKSIKGKLPQRKITTLAAGGYSSYGNQIGLATGIVNEHYDDDFVAKRMEVGAVIGAVKKSDVTRKTLGVGDIIVLLGGETGRDGCGGATGSSKKHTTESINTCAAEVQKGNPVTERKIQRLFRNPELTKIIKKCNDFGAGGVSVAIGELADGLNINLDLIPKKYEGLTATELAISESQERMAVGVDPKDLEKFLELARIENLQATAVATVTNDARLRMSFKGQTVVDISRDFLNSNGVRQKISISVPATYLSENKKVSETFTTGEKIKRLLSDLNVCSKKGLIERFDSSIGSSTVLMPFGGKYQLSPVQAMVAKIPVIDDSTDTVSIMTYGYDAALAKEDPFKGALYAIVHAAAKTVACGGRYEKIRLSLQEYFERLEKDSHKWSKPFTALLGAFYAQNALQIPAIGGKDSMSGTFNDINVPPTVVAFAVSTENSKNIISTDFKKTSTLVALIKTEKDNDGLVDFQVLKDNFDRVSKMIRHGKVYSAYAPGYAGTVEAVLMMAFGNKIGVDFTCCKDFDSLFIKDYGSILIEVSSEDDLKEFFDNGHWEIVAKTSPVSKVKGKDFEFDLQELIDTWEKPLSTVFPNNIECKESIESIQERIFEKKFLCRTKTISPKVIIPVFPGTNCEYDMRKAFVKAGASTQVLVFRNRTSDEINDSIVELAKAIKNGQILALSGGFSAGDEPDGSGKFIASVLRNDIVKQALHYLLDKNDGLILGICNGFQALIKSGLLPFAHICSMDESSPTLTYNKIGRHVSTIVRTKVVSNLSPWISDGMVGEVFSIPVSHGEGRFVCSTQQYEQLYCNGQITTVYVDLKGEPTLCYPFNPNGSFMAVEGITSPDGRIFGKMAHSERYDEDLYKNIYGNKNQNIFKNGVEYFKL